MLSTHTSLAYFSQKVIFLVTLVVLCVLMAIPPRCWAQPLHIYTVILNDSHPTHYLNPIPGNTDCLNVSVTHRHPYLCDWIINNTQAAAEQHRDFVQYADGYSLVLLPFGQHFYYTACACLITEIGDKYAVMVGGPANASTTTTTNSPTEGPNNSTTSDHTNESFHLGVIAVPVVVLALLCVLVVMGLVMRVMMKKTVWNKHAKSSHF